MQIIPNKYFVKCMFIRTLGSRNTHSGVCPVHCRTSSIPRASTTGYNDTLSSIVANRIASQMSQTSLLGVILLREKRKMQRSNCKFILRVIFPLGLEYSILRRIIRDIRIIISPCSRKNRREIEVRGTKWDEWSEEGHKKGRAV